MQFFFFSPEGVRKITILCFGFGGGKPTDGGFSIATNIFFASLRVQKMFEASSTGRRRWSLSHLGRGTAALPRDVFLGEASKASSASLSLSSSSGSILTSKASSLSSSSSLRSISISSACALMLFMALSAAPLRGVPRGDVAVVDPPPVIPFPGDVTGTMVSERTDDPPMRRERTARGRREGVDDDLSGDAGLDLPIVATGLAPRLAGLEAGAFFLGVVATISRVRRDDWGCLGWKAKRRGKRFFLRSSCRTERKVGSARAAQVNARRA